MRAKPTLRLRLRQGGRGGRGGDGWAPTSELCLLLHAEMHTHARKSPPLTVQFDAADPVDDLHPLTATVVQDTEARDALLLRIRAQSVAR